MKVAVTAMGSDAESQVSARFGRAPYFLVVDYESGEVLDSIENPNVAAGGGAGVQSSQLLARNGVELVLTGNCGPKAFEVFEAAGIEICTGAAGTVADALKDFKAGRIEKTQSANVQGHFGI